jgi:hypothetical protein
MKKLGFLILAVILVLGTMGVGYSMWYQTVNVTGNVSTGSVCMSWVTPVAYWQTSMDPGPNYMGEPGDNVYLGSLDWTIDTNMDDSSLQRLDKNVGSTDITLPDAQDLDVTLNNVYPGYYNRIDTHAQNCGTIPVILEAAVLTYTDTYTNKVNTVTISAGKVGTILYINGPTQYGTDAPVLEIRWMNSTAGGQWEPGNTTEMSWDIRVLQAAEQNFNYSFTISIEAVQWNEYGNPPGP